jgi:hypothetical protein
VKNQSRKDHERLREAEAAARPEGPPAVPQVPQITERRIYHLNQPLVPELREDGGCVLGFLLPDGRALHFPLSPEQRLEIGRRMVAPSVEIAGAEKMPPGANGAPPYPATDLHRGGAAE